MLDAVNLHVHEADQYLLLILAIGALASTAIIGISIRALARRRTWPYLLVTFALTMLLGRTLFGVFSLGGTMDPAAHHLIEHGMDVATAALLVGAILAARTVDPTGDVST